MSLLVEETLIGVGSKINNEDEFILTGDTYILRAINLLSNSSHIYIGCNFYEMEI